MTSFAQILPQHFGYVAAVATLTGPLLIWQSIMCGNARKATSIVYPIQYATAEEAAKDPAAHRFNCVQRAHGNTLESLPTFYVTLLLSGTQYPVLAASLGGIWLVGRVLYSLGYYTGVAKKRMNGAVGHIGYLGLLITSGMVSYNLIKAEL